MTTKLTYIGGLPDGRIECPKTGRSVAFVRGKEFDAPLDLAVNLEYQNPSDWKTTDAVKKSAADRRETEKKAAEAEAAAAEAAKKGKA